MGLTGRGTPAIKASSLPAVLPAILWTPTKLSMRIGCRTGAVASRNKGAASAGGIGRGSFIGLQGLIKYRTTEAPGKSRFHCEASLGTVIAIEPANAPGRTKGGSGASNAYPCAAQI